MAANGRTTPRSLKRRTQAEYQLGNNGRVLIRASGTEPVLRVMVEAQDGALARRRCAETMAAAAAAG